MRADAQLKKRRAVIITGMHRSGTSLAANLLRHAGINIGQELIRADDGNRYGYFEDVDFHAFHERILSRANQSYLVQDLAVLGEVTAEETKKAQALIQERRHRKIWGFKDPRTCLFLDFWDSLLPQAGYVFVYRHPLEVVLSLLRRGEHFDVEALARPLAALRSWEVHNRALLAFRRQHPERCVLGNISRVTANTKRFVDRVAKKLAVPLKAEGTEALYHNQALKQFAFSADTTSILEQIAPESVKLYRLLEGEADLPSRTSTKVRAQPLSQSRKLQAIVSKLAKDGEPQEDRVAPVFQLLLAALKPQWVLASKDALDGFRSERIRTLEADAARRQGLLDTQKTELKDVSGHTRDLGALVAKQEGQLTELTAHAEHLKQFIAAQQEQLQAMNARADQLGQAIAEQQRGLQALTVDNKELHRRMAAKEEQLQAQTFRLQQETARAEGLKNALAGKEKQLKETNARAAELQKILAGKEQRLQRSAAEAANLEEVVASQQAHSEQIQSKLDAIEGSRAWRLAQKWHGLKHRLGFKPRPRALDIAPDEQVIASQPPEMEASPTRQADEGPAGPPQVLFISHDARPHGAQILLLHLLKWIKANSDVPFQVLLKEGGSLRPEFEALAPVMVWNERRSSPVGKANGAPLATQLKRANIGLVYSNTITNGKVLSSLTDLNCPVICHVHELEYCLNYQTELNNNKQIRKLASHYIAVSQAVKQSLRQNLKIRESQIDVVYEFIPMQNGSGQQTHARDRIRRKLKIPPGASVVGGCGTTDWRKGPDLFVQLARLVQGRQPGKPVHFVWVGGHSEGPLFAALWHDVKHMNLEDCVHFTGAVRNPLEYFSTFDVFALTSREDPYPLVNLEVASLGTPIVCFDDSGGAKEFVEEDCGFVVPYLDLDTMADRVSELLSSTELRQRMGDRAASKVRERHDLEDTAPQVLRIIQRFL